MTPVEAISLARDIKARKRNSCPAELRRIVIALLEHGDQVMIPDLETTIRMVAANLHGSGRYYVEIAVDPQTKEVAHSFDPSETDPQQNN